jgi:hypothetical protein
LSKLFFLSFLVAESKVVVVVGLLFLMINLGKSFRLDRGIRSRNLRWVVFDVCFCWEVKRFPVGDYDAGDGTLEG